jgi:hypothetical protein
MPPALRTLNPSALGLCLGVVGLGHTLQVSNGFYSPDAMWWLSMSFACAIAGGALSRWGSTLSRPATTLLSVLLAAGVAWQIEQLYDARPGMYIEAGASLGIFRGFLGVQAAAVAFGLLRLRWLDRLWFPIVLASSLALGVWMIRASPRPSIDVVVVHKAAIDALLDGKDPYRITFDNIYTREDAARFYNPEAIIGGKLAFAYPYPPPSLLLAVPGQVLFGDYRYAELLLLVGATALIGFTTRGGAAKLAASVLATTPRAWFVIEQRWTEPIAVFLLALSVLLAARSPVAASWVAGVFVVTKQYLGFTGLSVLRLAFMARRRWMLALGGMVLAAAAVTLPLALWHPHAFIRNVVWLQALEPFRPDSLSYLAWAAHHGMGEGSFRWAVTAAALAALAYLVATPNTPAGFATAVAMTTFTTFAFGSKAFCNYYFFVIGALCAALAAIPEEGTRQAG